MVFAVYLGYGIRQKLVLAHRLNDRANLRLIAEAGVKKAIVTLANTDLTGYAALSDSWSNDEGNFKEIPVGDGSFSVSYTYCDERTGASYTRYGLVDEEGKININTVDQTVLRRLIKICLDFHDMDAQALGASIVDWRDGDSQLSIPQGSAEDIQYRNLHYPYESKDAPYDVIEELLLVNGMNDEIFDGLRNHITVYGEGKVNINTASEVTLAALGLGAGIVYKIMDYRNGEDKLFGTFDDLAFTSHATIIPQLSQFISLSAGELAELSVVVDQKLITTSHHFTVNSSAMLNNSKLKASLICVVAEDGKVLYWNES